jgi:hypothetical protein
MRNLVHTPQNILLLLRLQVASPSPSLLLHVDGDLVIFIQHCQFVRWSAAKLDENGPQALGDLGGEQAC